MTKQARDDDGNPIRRANTNPIIDFRQYVVKIEDGTEAELAANAIAKSMYAQCDPDDNQYHLIDSTIDFFLSTTNLYYEYQKLISNARTNLYRSNAG